MAIQLFQHNEEAYAAALSMMEKTGKAAIVHPTGTGKSFIGFKLCEDHPESVVCWLSPSEYIFKTQTENVKAVSKGYETDNIRFFTYARLMNMEREEMEKILPDYIILDEFHRCGAELWGAGVKNLLSLYPKALILGMSATAIRYLDNQRDMADELFGGNIASEMTLGEAIVRGILSKPKYVLSIFSYQKDLEKYEERVRRCKSKVARDAAGQYLLELRHTLEKADGLDEIFHKHMREKHGKYIVFCANKEHMDEMMCHREWFAKVDPHPHFYSVYSNDPYASKAFQDFKEDADEEHLRLLYCIDTLNEGVHLEHISGVILLRPTVSPIIYKQQIGRALRANQKTAPVIFDIVLNIENLCSIGAIEEEMEFAAACYRGAGKEGNIVNERFTVIDEVRDCRMLFERLNDALTASWRMMYQQAKAYWDQNGHLEIPVRYATEDGYALGRWIFQQRGIRKGQIQGSLSQNQIRKLDAIGMIWDTSADFHWTRNYEAARAYFIRHGHLNVPVKHVTGEGVALGQWLASLRCCGRAGAQQKYLTAERIAKLDAIGMIWNVPDYQWERYFQEADAFYRKNGHLNVPGNYVTEEGMRLGNWISRLRKLRMGRERGTPPSSEQIERLNKIGMVWQKGSDSKWETFYEAAREYAREHGNLQVPVIYQTDSGIHLGSWIQRQRRMLRQGKLPKGRAERLNELSAQWVLPDPWMYRYALVKAYLEEHGTCRIPQNVVREGVWLGKWIALQQKACERGGLSEQQKALLSQLPLEKTSQENPKWEAAYEDAAGYYRQYGHLQVEKTYRGQSGCRLGPWLMEQRKKRKQGELSAEQIALLDGIGFDWKRGENSWEKGYRYAKAYFQQHGDLHVQRAYRCEDGYALGKWIFQYQKAYHGEAGEGTLSREKIRALEEIGMEWEAQSAWDVKFSAVKEYYGRNGRWPDQHDQKEDVKKLGYWLLNQRKSYRCGKLSAGQIQRLGEIGITETWLTPRPEPFEKGYGVAKAYYEENGSLNVPSNYQHKSGFWLGAWIEKIREKKAELTREQVKKLEEIGFLWERTDGWEERFEAAEAYARQHGRLPLEMKNCQTEEERRICQWLRRQMARKNEGKMPREQIERLERIGVDWLNAHERSWNRGFSHAQSFYAENGHLNIAASYLCDDGYPLGKWLENQKTKRKKMPPEKIKMLEDIGFQGMR